MNILKCAAGLAAIALMVGCEKSSDSAYTDQTADQKNDMARARRERPEILTPTSRPDPSGNRVYSGGTNAAEAREPDNTGINVRDRSDATLTPVNQGTSEADREITRRIRAAIIGKDGLSVNALNVKVITVDGRVTLRGPVNSQEEKDTIAALVRSAAEGVTVDDQLEVKATEAKATNQ